MKVTRLFRVKAPGVALRLARAAATGLPRLVTMLAEDAASLAAG